MAVQIKQCRNKFPWCVKKNICYNDAQIKTDNHAGKISRLQMTQLATHLTLPTSAMLSNISTDELIVHAAIGCITGE